MRYLLLLLTSGLLLASCRKENISLPTPGKPGEPLTLWSRYTKASSPLNDDQINAITIDKNDVKWIGTSKSLIRLVDGAWTVFNIPGLPEPYVTSIAVTNDGTVWVGTTKGLARYRQNAWTLFTPANSELDDDEVMCMTYDSQRDVLWVATSTGFAKIKDENWQYHDEISHELILSMTTDRDGALWLGTFNHLAFRGTIRKFYEDKWTGFPLVNYGFHSAFPYAIAMEKNGNIIAALAGTQVKEVISYSNGNWKSLELSEDASGLKSILVENDEIWAGGTRLVKVGDRNQAALAIPGTDSPIQCMAIDSKGAKWIGTMYGGLVVYFNK